MSENKKKFIYKFINDNNNKIQFNDNIIDDKIKKINESIKIKKIDTKDDESDEDYEEDINIKEELSKKYIPLLLESNELFINETLKDKYKGDSIEFIHYIMKNILQKSIQQVEKYNTVDLYDIILTTFIDNK